MDDTTMAIRMIEYDFAIAIENVQKEGRRYRMELPRSCVLYLRSGSNTPDFLEVEIVLYDESVLLYRVPTIKLEMYTKDKIFEKDLLMLLPFYIMRYEKDIHEISENPRLFQQLLNEYEEIRRNLEDELSEAGKSKWYMDLNKLIIKISDYICQNEEKVRKGVGDIMGGMVLELESERLERIHREAMAKATAEAEIRGEARGEIKGEEKGEERLSTLINCLILDGRNAEVQLVTTDKETRQRLYKEYEI